jgi:hypothetical protein
MNEATQAVPGCATVDAPPRGRNLRAHLRDIGMDDYEIGIFRAAKNGTLPPLVSFVAEGEATREFGPDIPV